MASAVLALVAPAARAETPTSADFPSRSAAALAHLQQAREHLTEGALAHVLTRRANARVAEQAGLLRATRERLLDAIDAYGRVAATADDAAMATFITQQESLLSEAERVAIAAQAEPPDVTLPSAARSAEAAPAPAARATAAAPSPVDEKHSSEAVVPSLAAGDVAPRAPSPSRPSPLPLDAVALSGLTSKLEERDKAAMAGYAAEASEAREESARTAAAMAAAGHARDASDAASATAADKEGKRLVRRTVGWYGIAIGGATAVVGGILEACALRDRWSLEHGGLANRTELTSTAQGASSLSTASVPFFAIGGALVATGAVLLYSARSGSEEISGEASARSESSGLRLGAGGLTW